MVKRVVRGATRQVYKRGVKPLFFRQFPDDTHALLMKTARVTQRTPGVRHLPKLWGYQSTRLEQDVFGFHFRNPVGLSAGFDKNIEIAPTIKSVGFGFMTGGSVTAEVCDGNPRPWFRRLLHTKSVLVHAGLPNAGVDAVRRTLAAYRKDLFSTMPLIVSVAKTNSREAATDDMAIKDYCTSLQLLEKQRIQQMFEINISCPNTYGGEPFTTPKRLEQLLSAVDALALATPVTIKMPINKTWTDFRQLLDVIVRHNIQGVSIGNLRHDRSCVDARDGLTDDQKGNLSGAPTRQISTDLIRQTYAHYGDRLTIIGIGGVFTAEHAYEKIRAGASLVALITGMFFEGPQVVGEINAGLEQLLKRDGFANIADAIGADHKKRV